MTSLTIDYIGDELTIFAAATNWKAYMRAELGRYIAGDVGEVGAGLGAATLALGGLPGVNSWTCIEPDPTMALSLAEKVGEFEFGYPITALTGTLLQVAPAETFDAIIYIDVLEHIEDDRAELVAASQRLRSGGNIVVLCPAWQFLYSPFDKAVGHFRRHTKGSLRRVAPSNLVEVASFYMDSVGMMASVVNKLALRQSMPTVAQVRLWDKLMVPVSRFADPLLLRSFGKSVILVWTKP